MRAMLLASSLLLAVASLAQPRLRTFTVRNTNDEGSGSLRAAIEETNASCNGEEVCRIDFAIPGEGPWHTIRLRRPLPPILAPHVQIFGKSQPDTNPLGPEIEINGSLLEEGNGLDLSRSCDAIVAGLAINGFPANGILLGGHGCNGILGQIADNYIGCDPTGKVAVPNARGIWVDSPAGALYFHWTIRGNVIGGNRNSGIFVASGPQKIQRNVIGLTPALDGPLANGASGVAVLENGDGTDIDDNYIGFNRHFGVGLARGLRKVALAGNSFQANHQLAIDYGMDGVSQDAENIPEITSAVYEDGETVIRIRSKISLGTFPRIYVYANDAPDPSGYGEGQYFLGFTGTASSGSREFVFRHPGDLRGKWVTATSMHVAYYGFLRSFGEGQGFVTSTSEFSRAVEVQ